jgi:hypothetical protein
MARPFPPRAYINRPSQTGNKEIFAQTSGLAVFSRRVAKKTLLRNTFPPQVLASVLQIDRANKLGNTLAIGRLSVLILTISLQELRLQRQSSFGVRERVLMANTA